MLSSNNPNWWYQEWECYNTLASGIAITFRNINRIFNDILCLIGLPISHTNSNKMHCFLSPRATVYTGYILLRLYFFFFFWLNCKLIYVVVSHYLLYISPCIFFIFPLWFSSIQIKLRFFFHIWFLIKMSFYLFIGFFYDPIMHVVILLCMAQKRMRHVMEISHDYILL